MLRKIKNANIMRMLSILLLLYSCPAKGNRWPLPENANNIWTGTYGEFQRYSNQNDPSNDIFYMHSGLDIDYYAGTPVYPVTNGQIRKIWNWINTDNYFEPERADINQCILIEDDENQPNWEVGFSYSHVQLAELRGRLFRERRVDFEIYGINAACGMHCTIDKPIGTLAPITDPHLHLAREIGHSYSDVYLPWQNDAWEGHKAIENPLFYLPPKPDFADPQINEIVFDYDESVTPDPGNELFPTKIVDGELIQVIFGKVDIIADIYDQFCAQEPCPDPTFDRALGVYSVGYSVDGPGTADVEMKVRYFRGDIGAIGYGLNFDPDFLVQVKAEALAIYRVNDRMESELNAAYYSVSNIKSEPSIFGEQEVAGCWNTRMVDSEEDPWDATSAIHPVESKFPDAMYTVTVFANDLQNESSATKDVIVDNWAPFVKRVQIYKGVGTLKDGEFVYSVGEDTKDRELALYYDAEWVYDENGWSIFNVHRKEAIPDASNLVIEVTFSESVSEVEVEIGSPGAQGVVEGGGYLEDNTVFWGLLPSGKECGTNWIVIDAKDFAGNTLDADPETIANRASNGTWQDDTPSTSNQDVNHSVVVAPDVWIAEGDASPSYYVLGLRADGLV